MTFHKPIKVLGLITARGGSKGIPNKNIISLCGNPLLAYTAMAAKNSKLLDRVVITTDSLDIANVALQLGIEVPFIRPEYLAHDNSPHIDCVRHAIKALYLQNQYIADYVMILQPTSPFRTSEDIDNAIRMAMQTSCDAVVGVVENCTHESKMYFVNNDFSTRPYIDNASCKSVERRQDCPVHYVENGAIYLQKTNSIFEEGNASSSKGGLISSDLRAFIMPDHQSIDIDTPFDLKMAELLMTSLSEKREKTI